MLWYFSKKYSAIRFFDFGLVWSIRARFRLRSSSFYIFVDLYLAEFLSYVSVQILGTNLQCGRASWMFMLCIYFLKAVYEKFSCCSLKESVTNSIFCRGIHTWSLRMLEFLYVSLIRVALWRKLVIRQTVILQLSILLTRSVFVYPHI